MIRLRQLGSRENRFLWLAGGGAFCLAAIAGAPADLLASGLEARAPLLEISGAQGTVWRGAFADVAYSSVSLGRVSYKLKPWEIIAGRLSIDATSADGAIVGRGSLALTPSGFDARNISAQFNLASIRRYTFFGVPYQGFATLTARSLELSKQRCKAVDAKASTTMLDGVARSWSGGPLPLKGDVTCKEGKLALTLSGANADGALRVEALIAGDLSYAMTVAAEPKRAEVGVALRQLGFEGDSARLSLHAAGKLKGLTS